MNDILREIEKPLLKKPKPKRQLLLSKPLQSRRSRLTFRHRLTLPRHPRTPKRASRASHGPSYRKARAIPIPRSGMSSLSTTRAGRLTAECSTAP